MMNRDIEKYLEDFYVNDVSDITDTFDLMKVSGTYLFLPLVGSTRKINMSPPIFIYIHLSVCIITFRHFISFMP